MAEANAEEGTVGNSVQVVNFLFMIRRRRSADAGEWVIHIAGDLNGVPQWVEFGKNRNLNSENCDVHQSSL